ncbi:hypothetical protein [Janibacter sp. GXQ6167]|uniref:hypothetical protein n=1 Tax=Janibacter sp. GXQ6167 TaxID=3240791 RepID=UPI003524DEB5
MTVSPVPETVARELTRAVRRWQQLPLDRAVSFVPAVHDLMAELAGTDVPDLGPAVIMDQLRVVIYDAYQAGEPPPSDLDDRLAELRLTWA